MCMFSKFLTSQQNLDKNSPLNITFFVLVNGQFCRFRFKSYFFVAVVKRSAQSRACVVGLLLFHLDIWKMNMSEIKNATNFAGVSINDSTWWDSSFNCFSATILKMSTLIISESDEFKKKLSASKINSPAIISIFLPLGDEVLIWKSVWVGQCLIKIGRGFHRSFLISTIKCDVEQAESFRISTGPLEIVH